MKTAVANKAVVAYVFQEDFGANKAGEVVHLDADQAQPLLDAGIIEEADNEAVNGSGEEDTASGDEFAAPEQNAALNRTVNRLSTKVEDSIAKAVEQAVSKVSKASVPNLTLAAETKKEVFRGIGELMLHVWRAKTLTGREQTQSRNMLRAYQQEMITKSPLGMNEGTNSQGGYDVKPEWYDRVWDKIRDYPKLVEMTTVIPAKSKTFNIPAISETSLADGSRHGGVLAYYLTEGSTATSSYPALTQVTANLETLVILVYTTLQLLQDGNIEGIEKLVNEKALLEMLWQQDVGVIAGSGSGQPTGILNQPSLVTITHSSHDSAAMFGFDDLSNMYKAMYPPSRNNAVWLVNPEAHSVLLQMTFPNAASTSTYPAWSLTYSGHDEFPLRLFGRPVIECLMGCSQLGTSGDIIFADLAQLFTYERAGLQIDTSDQLQFATLQIAYRFVYRYDIKSPWTAPLTSVDGNYNYSPFITLSSRGT